MNDEGQSERYERTYSLAEIAQHLNRPATTVSTWRSQYKEFIDAATIGAGRSKRYKREAFDIFKLIHEMKSRNEPHEMIRRALTESVDQIIVDNNDDEKPALIGEILEGYQNVLAVLQDQQDILKDQKEGLDELRKENGQLRNQLSQVQENQESQQDLLQKQEEQIAERDRKLMENLNAIRFERNKKQEGFFSRFFSKRRDH